MAKQEQIQKQKACAEEGHADETSAATANAELAAKTEATLDSIDDVLEDQLDEELLADIDDVLEEDAEQFVASYIQAGGE